MKSIEAIKNATTKTKALIALATFCLIALLSWRYVQSTPQYSLYKAYSAIQQHDYDGFSKYVDTSSVIDSVTDRIIADMTKTDDTQNKADAFGAAIANGFIQMMKPAMKDAFVTGLRKSIESGDIATKNNIKVDLYKSLYRAMVKIDGKTVTITIRTKDDQPITLHMRHKDGYWQVYDVESPLLSAIKPGA